MSKYAAKALLLTTVAFGGSAMWNPAQAGLLDPAPAYPVRPSYGPPVYDWTGFYTGVSAGGAFASANWNYGLNSGSVSRGSGLIGGTIGYNSMTFSGPIVLSEEFDFSWRPYDFSVAAPACGPTCSLTSDWVSTARLRFGYATGLFMPYVTGGLTMSNFVASATGLPFGTNNNVTFSWIAGVGVEFMVSGPWSVKLEYLYMNHGGLSCSAECNPQGNGPISLNISENVVRAGFNYRFGGW